MSTDNIKPIPKSLHTVTVIVKLARMKQASQQTLGTPAAAVEWSLAFLGYADTPDTHGLAAAALKVLAA